MEASAKSNISNDAKTKMGVSADTDIDPKTRAHYRKQFERVIRKLKVYAKNPDVDLLRRAYKFSFKAHENQIRKSGVPYIEHCIETALILTELRMDVMTVAAGLLHDVVENTGISVEDVKDEFGSEIAQLVDGVTKISELKFRSHAEKQAENFRKMIFSMAQDLRVIMIKFADRMHNMRTIQFLPKEKAVRIALETREVYAPLAHRFGIYFIKRELEDSAFKVLEPEAYEELSKKVTVHMKEWESYMKRISRSIETEFKQNNIQLRTSSRVKSLYSIYRKMIERGLNFDEIHDLLAIRIIVGNVEECYYGLGLIHKLFKPLA